MFENLKVVLDGQYGYYRLDPIPEEEELNKFYEEIYYKERGTTENYFKRMLGKNIEKANEIEWLSNSYFLDSLEIFKKYLNIEKPYLLDVGCGMGDMLEFFKEKGFDVFGVEPSKDAIKLCEEKGINIFNGDINSFVDNCENKFDIINLTNVLEHVPYPNDILLKCKDLLNNNGIIRIQVPNDFNEFQNAAKESYSLDSWWVSVPDHINYFNINSLSNLLEKIGFDIIYKTVDFPMELFLLMGDLYINDSNMGKICHEKRINFERNIPNDLRKKLYSALCELGLGRQIIIYAVKGV